MVWGQAITCHQSSDEILSCGKAKSERGENHKSMSVIDLEGEASLRPDLSTGG